MLVIHLVRHTYKDLMQKLEFSVQVVESIWVLLSSLKNPSTGHLQSDKIFHSPENKDNYHYAAGSEGETEATLCVATPNFG